MIFDRSFNQKNQQLTITYIDKLGNRQYYQKYLHHITTYEYDENGEFETWNGKRCNKVFKDSTQYKPNEFDILEYIYNLPDDIRKQMEAMNTPKLYTFDIETEVCDKFPEPTLAEQRVTAIALVGMDLSCIVFGLHNMSEEQKARLSERYLDFIDKNEFARNLLNGKLKGKKPKVLYQYFNCEEDMLQHWFKIILPKIPAIAGWNSYRFDFMYLCNRYERLFGKGELMNVLKKISPTGELRNIKWEEKNFNRPNRMMAPRHTLWLDYMDLCKQYDYILRPYEAYSLDWVASAAVKANKIKYEGTLQQLYERDYEWYYYYNAVDSLLVMLIHYRLKCLESPCSVSAITFVPLFDAMGQIALTTANVFKEFYNDNKHVVWDWDAVPRNQLDYEGAFCGCVPGRYEYNVCCDFASLYPSQVQTCNFSFENQIENMVGPDSLGRYVKVPWTKEQLDEFRKDPNYFVSVMGNVYRNDKDFAFKRMQRRLKKKRDSYKYLGWKIEAELLSGLDKLIKEKEEELNKS
jgi:DNA polymerase elongation subunit (family B)